MLLKCGKSHIYVRVDGSLPAFLSIVVKDNVTTLKRHIGPVNWYRTYSPFLFRLPTSLLRDGPVSRHNRYREDENSDCYHQVVNTSNVLEL
jgi:hypothetical protein